LVLQSFDADDTGAKNAAWWLKRYAQAKRWPTHPGKDPCDLMKRGYNLRAWVQAGLLSICPHDLLNFFDYCRANGKEVKEG
ncbi:MAG: hypothetical protein ACYC9O_04340, partial [Candidatus Latescibacterota bacterium]